MKYLTKQTDLSNKTVLLMGLGLNGGGLGTALYLAPRVKKLIITDLKSEEELRPSIEQLKDFSNIEFVLGKHRIEDFKSVDIVFKGAGIKFSNEFIKTAIENDIIVETDVGYFFELAEFPIIGITGSKGKSTTTHIIYEILSSQYDNVILGGNITISPLKSLNEKKDIDLAVLELSSWQLADLSIHKKSPNISVLTTIFPDHLNYYSSMDEYYEDKKFIFKFQKSDDFTIINLNNEYLFKSLIDDEIKSNKVFIFNFDEKDPDLNFEDKLKKVNEALSKKICFFILKIEDEVLLYKIKDFNLFSDIIEPYRSCHEKFDLKIINKNYDFYILPSISNTKLLGEHNKTNILLSICASLISKVNIDKIYNTIKNTSGMEFRLQVIRRLNGITFINDTTATVPDAVAASIHAIKDKGRIFLIAGGVDKKLPIDNMVKSIKENVYKLYLLDGNGSDLIRENLNKAGYNSIEYGFTDLRKLVEYAYKNANENDIILLSPGFASFNLFTNEFDRGRIFNEAVLGLK